MRVTIAEREALKLAAAFEDCAVSDYLWGLHYARSRGEIMPGGARIIRCASELAELADKAATDLAKLGYPSPPLRQAIINMRSILEHEGRPIRYRRRSNYKKNQ